MCFGLGWKHALRGSAIDVYFSICPLCFSQNSIKSELSIGVLFSKDHVACSKCGAKWEVAIGKTVFSYGKLKWAKLVFDGVDGKGSGLLNDKKKPEFWQRMALKGRRPLEKSETAPKVVKEKEIVKEVIVKIRCSYCRKLYDETLNECPHCTASR